MTEFTSTDELLDLLRERNPRFDPRSYSFVLEALNSVFHSLGEKRHITGAELAEGVRQVAMERFGPLARTVLEHWGICLLYTSPSPRDLSTSRMPSSA